MSTKLALIKHMVLPAHPLLQFSRRSSGSWGRHSPHKAGVGLQRKEGLQARVAWFERESEPLSSRPDGKIRCRELLKTRLRAHDRGVHSHQCKASTQELRTDIEAGKRQWGKSGRAS